VPAVLVAAGNQIVIPGGRPHTTKLGRGHTRYKKKVELHAGYQINPRSGHRYKDIFHFYVFRKFANNGNKQNTVFINKTAFPTLYHFWRNSYNFLINY
jgi:hypothetical protein